MEIVIKTILWQIITHYAGTQDIIKKLASCDPCGRKSGLKTVAELLRLSIYTILSGTLNFALNDIIHVRTIRHINDDVA